MEEEGELEGDFPFFLLRSETNVALWASVSFFSYVGGRIAGEGSGGLILRQINQTRKRERHHRGTKKSRYTFPSRPAAAAEARSPFHQCSRGKTFGSIWQAQQLAIPLPDSGDSGEGLEGMRGGERKKV